MPVEFGWYLRVRGNIEVSALKAAAYGQPAEIAAGWQYKIWSLLPAGVQPLPRVGRTRRLLGDVFGLPPILHQFFGAKTNLTRAEAVPVVDAWVEAVRLRLGGRCEVEYIFSNEYAFFFFPPSPPRSPRVHQGPPGLGGRSGRAASAPAATAAPSPPRTRTRSQLMNFGMSAVADASSPLSQRPASASSVEGVPDDAISAAADRLDKMDLVNFSRGSKTLARVTRERRLRNLHQYNMWLAVTDNILDRNDIRLQLNSKVPSSRVDEWAYGPPSGAWARYWTEGGVNHRETIRLAIVPRLLRDGPRGVRMDALCHAVRSDKSIQKLKLSKFLHDAAVEELSGALKENTVLKELDLSANHRIGDYGAVAWGAMLGR